jgi:hypothetical protein
VSGYAQQAGLGQAQAGVFDRSWRLFEEVVAGLADPGCGELTHAQLEDRLTECSRELMRSLFQDHLDLRASREQRLLGGVPGADGVVRARVERGHQRDVATVFGTVTVTRIAYRASGVANLYPADAVLNLPVGRHSHGLRRLAAIEATRGSFEQVGAALERASGVRVGKRQLEALAGAAAADVAGFYAQREWPACPDADLLVLTFDGKGILMRPPGAARGHRQGDANHRPQAGHPSVPRGETRPQTHGRARRRRRRRARPPRPRRRHLPARPTSYRQGRGRTLEASG